MVGAGAVVDDAVVAGARDVTKPHFSLEAGTMKYARLLEAVFTAG
jgi:hypothetical protein